VKARTNCNIRKAILNHFEFQARSPPRRRRRRGGGLRRRHPGATPAWAPATTQQELPPLPEVPPLPAAVSSTPPPRPTTAGDRQKVGTHLALAVTPLSSARARSPTPRRRPRRPPYRSSICSTAASGCRPPAPPAPGPRRPAPNLATGGGLIQTPLSVFCMENH
jgi:hypothetical protein